VEVPLPGSAIEQPAEDEVGSLPSLDEEAPVDEAPAEEDAETE